MSRRRSSARRSPMHPAAQERGDVMMGPATWCGTATFHDATSLAYLRSHDNLVKVKVFLRGRNITWGPRRRRRVRPETAINARRVGRLRLQRRVGTLSKVAP